LAIFETRSIVREQCHVISDRTESRNILAIPDDVVQLVVVSRLHASELFISIETITAKFLGQYCESGGVGRVDLAGSAGLRNDASDDGVFRVGITVRVRGIASCGLAPEDHMIWVAACGVSVQSMISQGVMDIPESFDVLA
jgi:hypothetical protein